MMFECSLTSLSTLVGVLGLGFRCLGFRGLGFRVVCIYHNRAEVQTSEQLFAIKKILRKQKVLI